AGSAITFQSRTRLTPPKRSAIWRPILDTSLIKVNPGSTNRSPVPPLKDFAGSVAIVVSSCDAFFDAWRPFVFFFQKYWPDCPFETHLIVNRLRVESKIVRPIAVG